MYNVNVKLQMQRYKKSRISAKNNGVFYDITFKM